MPADEERQRELSERFSENLRRLREARGLSQSDLAREMTARGWRYYQSTVYKIEHGERKVDFFEAGDLAAILQVSADQFTLSSAEARETEAVWSAGARLRQHYELVAEAAGQLLRLHDAAARILEQHEGSKHASVRDARDDVAARMRMYGLDKAVAEGVRRHEEQGLEGGS